MKKLLCMALCIISIALHAMNSDEKKPVKKVITPRKKVGFGNQLTVHPESAASHEPVTLAIQVDDKACKSVVTPEAHMEFNKQFKAEANKIRQNSEQIKQEYIHRAGRENSNRFSLQNSEHQKMGLIIDTLPAMYLCKYIELYKKLYKASFNIDATDSQALLAACEQYKLHQAESCCVIL